MSAGKHTEGNWRAGVMTMSAKDWAQLRGERIDIVQRGQDVIAAVWCGDDRDGEEEANARLIAAAPELEAFAASWVRFVEATFAPVNAEAGLRELDDDHELTITVEQFREFYDAARAAIAKAEGPADA